MKGTVFQKPFEFKLVVDGESWHQGDTITGTLTAKNHTQEEITAQDINVFLAHGTSKKVEKKADDAFNVLTSASMPSSQKIGPQGEAHINWSFSLDRNCPITDASGSLYLLYGFGQTHTPLGQLRLPIAPMPVILDFLEIFQLSFYFVVKSKKAKKGSVEVRLVPPASKTFAALEDLVISFQFDDERLEINYVFTVKVIDPNSAVTALKKAKKEFKQSFLPSEYLLPNKRINHERMQAAIEEALGNRSTLI